MAPTELTEILDAQPFVPFRLCVASGNAYDIDAPHRLIVGNRFVHIGLPLNPGDRVADRTVRIDLLRVTELGPLTSPHSQGGNRTGVG